MVRSILDLTIRYPEIQSIDPEDEEYDAPMYEVELFGKIFNVAVGKTKYAFSDNDIVYFPVYLVGNDKIISQIGVYEIMDESLPELTDSDGDPDLAQMSQPLLYDFVTMDMLKKYVLRDVDSVKSKTKSNKANTERGDGHADDLGDSDNEEDEAEKKRIRREKTFDKSKSEFWIQRFMKSNEYSIKDNEGGGDCFFSAIRDGLATIGKSVTVMELRNRISNAATPELYEQYRRIYDELLKDYEDIVSRIKTETEKAKQLKIDVAKVTNRGEKAVLLATATKLRDTLKSLRDEKTKSKDMLGEFKWISKLTTFPKFVKALRTCSFWADDWATSVIERLYNIKVILFSEENYEEGDYANVLQCGRADDELLDKGIFRPTEYIMMAYTGSHYKLITHKGKGAFTYNELPNDVIDVVRDKCMERNVGLYSIIPEFKQIVDKADEEAVIEDPTNLQLYNEGAGTVFQFYDKAAVKPAPGKGSGEILGTEGVNTYKGLTGDWRRKLSHGYEKNIKLDDHTWKTVDHYVEAQKYANENPDFYLLFTHDSGSEIGNDVEMARAAAAGKKYEGKTLRPKGVKPDSDWDELRENEALEKALKEKFKDPELASLLRSTGNAKLMLYRKGKPARVEIEMMRVRRTL